jgi:hypothetical protein
MSASAVIAAAAALLSASIAQATHEPANKPSAAGSNVEVMQANNPAVPILAETVKASNPSDLVIGVTLECSIVTDVTTSGSNDTEGAFGQVRIWVEVNGRPVPVSSTEGDDGKVVFCNRAYQRQVQDYCDPPLEGTDDCNDTEKTFLRTRTSNAFNWFSLNPATLGTNILNIVAYAEFTTSRVGDNSSAEAAVGKRTMIIHPVMATNDEEVGGAQPTPEPQPTPTPGLTLPGF